MKYRRKPAIIDALLVQVGYKNLDEIIEFVGADNICPIERRPDYVLKIKTLEGDMAVGFGDYIIKGSDEGEFSPIDASIFEALYERVDQRLDKPVVHKRDGNDLYLAPEALRALDEGRLND